VRYSTFNSRRRSPLQDLYEPEEHIDHVYFPETGVVQRRGLLTYSRGKIRVLNRDGLEATSCACYRITRAAYDDLRADKSA
jgi:hypothetical protein